MLNRAKPNDFFLDVEGVGHFRFNRRTYGAQIKIDSIIARILGPNGQQEEEDAIMLMHANLVAGYKALAVECPPGWEDLEAIDLTEEPEKDQEIFRVYMALKEKLDSFRVSRGNQAAGSGGEASGAGAVQDDAILATEPLPASANGPEVAGAR